MHGVISSIDTWDEFYTHLREIFDTAAAELGEFVGRQMEEI